MADGVFNIAKGRVVELYANVENNAPANSAFIVVLLKAAGLEADDTLNNYDDLAALLAASNDEADFTNYARKVLTDADLAAVPAPDDTNNRRDLDIPDLTWTAAGGAANNSVGKLLVCYDPDTTGGTDGSIVPLTYHDFVVTTDGSDVTAQIAAAGFYRAS
jgi:hypothetical protein